jgi:hypothetical protein
MDETLPEVVMLRNVIATTAHDIGGLASALLLRADVLEHGTADTTVRAMRSIAAELRVLGQQLRALRAADGADTLAPSQNGAALHWAAGVTRFGVGLLPRGSAVDCKVDDTIIPHGLAQPLWFISLSLLGAIAEEWPDTRFAVQIDNERQTDASVLTFGATVTGKPFDVAAAMRGTWWEWAILHAEQHQLRLSNDAGRVLVRLPTVVAS